MPESVCEELFDNPFLTFADYLSLLRRKRIAKGFDYDDLLKPFTFSDHFKRLDIMGLASTRRDKHFH